MLDFWGVSIRKLLGKQQVATIIYINSTSKNQLSSCLKNGRFLCFPGGFLEFQWSSRHYISGILARNLFLARGSRLFGGVLLRFVAVRVSTENATSFEICGEYVGCGSLPVAVTTRIVTSFRRRSQPKPSFTVPGPHPRVLVR